MRVSLKWLGDLLGGARLDGARVAEILTAAGIEVESVTKRGAFSGVVVAEVRGKKPHPDAQKLTLVDVFDGSTVTQVVCGAPNVPEVGWKVLWARPGAKVPMGEGGALVELAPKLVRGIESPGMLCAEDELGLGESHAGILCIAPSDALAPGTDAASALGFPDEILELGVTPNRPDCLGHVGVAREVAAGKGVAFHAPVDGQGDAGTAPTIRIEDPEGCSRYHATVLEGLTVGPSPLADQLRLAALGVRPISNVVDVTNLAMLEHGQPLHAFDLDTLPGATIIVRRARAGETLETLDGVVRDLVPTDLLICDGNDRVIALAGVMGGKATEVTASTKRVLLEVASFAPSAIRATAKRLGLSSEASHRFERGVDPNTVAVVARSAAHRLAAFGARVTAARDEVARPIAPVQLELRAQRTRLITGLVLDAQRQAQHLSSIGLGVKLDGDTLHVTVPTFRPDLTREIDLVEEVLRLEGYDRVPLTIPGLRAAPPELKHRLADRARDLLNALGFDEAITYAFVSPRDLAALALSAPRDRIVRIANPLREEQSAMRTSLVTGLVRAAARNVAHGVSDVRLFEVGHTFVPLASANELPLEQRHVAAIWLGTRDGWLKPGEPVDYFDLRGVVDELARGLQHTFEVVASSQPWLHPGVQGALALDDGTVVGWLGELHPRVAAALGLETRALVFELSLSALPSAKVPLVRDVPRFPAVSRDASFLIETERSSAEIARAISALSIPLLVEAAPREDYRDPTHVPVGHKSMLWSFTYRATDRTLTDAEVKNAHEQLVIALRAQLGARLR
ncbi:MAG: phenylalanine--tRNA ligase subunit beta [Polyangia bacterium]